MEIGRKIKHLGICPFCSSKISPFIVEENFLRRDVCECPECHTGILVCRSPGCQNYAKTGKYYDNELCPSCLKNLPRDVITTAGAVLSVALSLKNLRSK